MINIVTVGLWEQENNVTQSWPGILKSLHGSFMDSTATKLLQRNTVASLAHCKTITKTLRDKIESACVTLT